MPNESLRADARATPLDRRAALGLIAAGALLTVSASPAAGLPAAAPSLAAEFEAAWAAEQAVNAAYPDGDPAWQAAYEAASDRTAAIVERIIAEPARGLEGLKLKGRAFLWCYSNDAEEGLGVLADRAETTDFKLIHSLTRDLLALA